MSNNTYNYNDSLPNMVKITDIIDEATGYKTFLFNYNKNCLPGQFLMVWLPRIDEKPFTVSYNENGKAGITVQLKGRFTKELFNKSVGDKIGIRGPYGNGYTINNNKKACIVSGGSGTATVLPLVNSLNKPTVIIGARTKDFLLYIDRLPNAIYTTDDGTYGIHGNVIEALKEELSSQKYDIVYTCGPEIMMESVIDVCKQKGVACQFTLERYMKCGIGICGNCTCGSKRVCVEGPVFSLRDLCELTEFNKSHRARTGKKEYL